MNRIMKHAWLEPKFVAQVEWMADHPGLSMQIEQQVGRAAMEQYAAGGGWPDPDAAVTFVIHEEPDWDWWEPTSEWRRLAARDREAGL